jgi:hypothetical protein
MSNLPIRFYPIVTECSRIAPGTVDRSLDRCDYAWLLARMRAFRLHESVAAFPRLAALS